MRFCRSFCFSSLALTTACCKLTLLFRLPSPSYRCFPESDGGSLDVPEFAGRSRVVLEAVDLPCFCVWSVCCSVSSAPVIGRGHHPEMGSQDMGRSAVVLNNNNKKATC